MRVHFEANLIGQIRSNSVKSGQAYANVHQLPDFCLTFGHGTKTMESKYALREASLVSGFSQPSGVVNAN
jgi:hypothetical protein